MNLDELNQLPPREAETELERCCASRLWARAMAQSRPYANRVELLARADSVWNGLSREDWLEAFAGHPRIGEKIGAEPGAPSHASTAKWASEEQSGTSQASDDVLARLARGNAEYDRRFGYVFIVCATGKSAAEMLALLEARLGNSPENELRIAAGEQAKITRIRLEKLLS